MSSPPKSAGAYPTSLPHVGLDEWIDSQYQKPYPLQTVTGWTGRFMVKCQYNFDKKVWETKKGTEITVLMWNKIMIKKE